MVGKPKKPYHSVIWWQWPLFHCSYFVWICGDILLRNNMSNKITFSANKLHAFNFNLAFVSLSRAFPIRFCNIFANGLPVTIMTFKKTKHMSNCKSANTFFMRRSHFVGTQFRQKNTIWSPTEMALLKMPFWVFLHFLFLLVSILKKGQCEEPSWPRQLIYLIHRSSGKNMQLEHWSYWGGYSRYKTYTIPSTFLTLIMGKDQGLLDGLIATLTSMSSMFCLSRLSSGTLFWCLIGRLSPVLMLWLTTPVLSKSKSLSANKEMFFNKNACAS